MQKMVIRVCRFLAAGRMKPAFLLASILCGAVLLLPSPAAAQTITVCRPNGDESWSVGDHHAINWNWAGVTGSIKLEYSTDGGGTWNVITSSTANDGSYLWSNVPNAPSATCRVKVSSVANPDVFDVSDADFTIAQPVITVTRPNGGMGGETWTVGEEHVIHWDWTGDFGTAKLEYSTDGGGTWNVISASADNDGSYQWTIPNAPSTQCVVKVTSTTDAGCFDVSDGEFTIASPVLTVLRPNGGETYYTTADGSIHWNWTGDFSNVKLEYSIDGGSAWSTISSSSPNDGCYNWNVPNAPSATCRVKITDAADAGAFDASDNNFTISGTEPGESLYVTSPCAGDTWLAGRPYNLTWTWLGAISYVKLEYTTDGGSSWSLISASVSNVGHWTWTVPGTPGANCVLRVSDASNPSKYDESSTFTINKQWISTTSPCAGDAWLVGRRYFVTWNWGGGFGNAKLEYSTDGGSSWGIIIANITNQGYWAWTVPDTPSENSLVQVTNIDNSQVYGRSDEFEIMPPVITVTSPLSGDTWKANRTYYLTWNWTGKFGDAKVEYTTDGGSNWSVIIAIATNEGYWAWSVPNTPSSNCMVRVTDVANIDVYATSGVFVISPPDGVAEQAADPRTERLTAKPNPSRGRTMLRYALPAESDVNLAILDASGRVVACPVSGRQKAGVYELAFDAIRVGRSRAPNGVYFCRLATGGHVQQCRFVITD